MKSYQKYSEKFIECCQETSNAQPWEYKIINKNHAKMKKIVAKMFTNNWHQQFFDEMFCSTQLCVKRWAACFSEIFEYDLKRSYQVFLEESKSKTATAIDVAGAKIAAQRLAEKIKNTK